VLGSTLANVLMAAGFQTQKEYYVNDLGNQIRTFGSRSGPVREVLGEPSEVPSDGYHGAYVIVSPAPSSIRTVGASCRCPRTRQLSAGVPFGTALVTEGIRRDLASLNVEFDEWFSEKSLHDSGEYDHVMSCCEREAT
jgi:arginyl-tRNA synthetase